MREDKKGEGSALDPQRVGSRILDVGGRVLLAWRQLIYDGQKSNYTYSQPDALIAATAVVHGHRGPGDKGGRARRLALQRL